MGELSPNLEAQLEKPTRGNYWLCRLAIPLSGDRRYSSGGFASIASKHFAGKVIRWAPIPYALSTSSGLMHAVTTHIDIDDTSRDWRQLVEGDWANFVPGSAATIWRAHPKCVEADWFKAFVGVIEKWTFPSEYVARINLRIADGPFRRLTPRDAWEINPAEFPNAEADVWTQLAPIIYGKHDSTGYGRNGMVPSLRVGAGLYLLSAGWLKAVDAVYEDGVLTSTADYTVTHPLLGGRRFTRIDFTTDPGVNVTVTADVQGYEATGDGTGALIENPLDQLKHIISNFILGDWMDGNWLATHSRIGVTFAGAAPWFTNFSYSSTHYQGERRSGYEIVAEFGVTHNVFLWWNPQGKIECDLLDPAGIPYGPFFNPDLDVDRYVINPRIIPEDRDRVTSISSKHVPDAAAGTYRANLLVREPDLDDDYPLAVSLPWSGAQ